MRITLMIGEAEKTFHTPFIKGRVLRNFIKLQKEKDLADMDTDTIDSIVELMVDAYSQQFTIDEFWDGIDSRNVITAIQEFIQDITGKNDGGQGKK